MMGDSSRYWTILDLETTQARFFLNESQHAVLMVSCQREVNMRRGSLQLIVMFNLQCSR